MHGKAQLDGQAANRLTQNSGPIFSICGFNMRSLGHTA